MDVTFEIPPSLGWHKMSVPRPDCIPTTDLIKEAKHNRNFSIAGILTQDSTILLGNKRDEDYTPLHTARRVGQSLLELDIDISSMSFADQSISLVLGEKSILICIASLNVSDKGLGHGIERNMFCDSVGTFPHPTTSSIPLEQAFRTSHTPWFPNYTELVERIIGMGKHIRRVQKKTVVFNATLGHFENGTCP